MIAQPAEETVTDFLTVSQPLNVCRLCESKDGPFLNIFEADKVTATKIEELMPFKVAENDDLPQKICFRCSAKLEETYQFMDKCIKTQINLRTALGKKERFAPELKITKSVWENLLNNLRSQLYLFCDARMKKMMEGIKNIPINPQNNSKNAEKPDHTANKPGNDSIKKNTSEISKPIEISKDIIDIESDGNVDDESEQIEKPARMARRKFAISNGGQLSIKPKTTAKRRSSVAALNVCNGWQTDKLNKTNISNADMCYSGIKKAMEGIKDIPINPLSLENNSKDAEKPDLNANKPGNDTIKNKTSEISKLLEISKDITYIESDGDADDESEQIKFAAINVNNGSQLLIKPKITAKRRSSVSALIKPKTTAKRTSDAPSITTNKKLKVGVEKDETNSNNASKKPIERGREQDSLWKEQLSGIKNINTIQSNQKDSDQSTPKANAKPTIKEKPFDIMDHVIKTKVNGVCDLFQCKLCNRDFWKMDVVQSHNCAKNRCVPKEDIVAKPTPPELPKPPTVKYINTKLGNDSKKFAFPETSNSSDKTDSDLRSPIVTEGNLRKSKPRTGPARKVKRNTKKSPSGKKQNRISEDSEDVIVEWKDGGQNCVRVKELRAVKGGDQIDRIGAKVKMYYKKRWFFGTVIMTERDDRQHVSAHS